MNRMLLLLNLFTLLFYVNLEHSVADESIIAYYSFDGNVEDSSGNENHGEIKGNLAWDKGQFGNSIHLEVGTHVEMLVSDTLHGDIFKSDPFTLSAWINPTFEGGTWQQIWRSLPNTSGHNTLFINKDEGKISWRGLVGGWTILCETDGGIIEQDVWSHVVVQSDGKNYRIYVDGEMSIETDFQETKGANEKYRLGGEGGEGYGGTIDDAVIFSRALDEKEIKSLGNGVEAFLTVEPKDKLTTSWANIKRSNILISD